MTTEYSSARGQRDSRPRGGGGGGGRRFGPRRRRTCFCKEGTVDYKDVASLRRYLTDRSRIESARKSGNCAKCQRQLQVAIKRARHLALLPFTDRHLRVTGPVAVGGRGGAGQRARDDDEQDEQEETELESAVEADEGTEDDQAEEEREEEERPRARRASRSTQPEPEEQESSESEVDVELADGDR